MDIGHKIKELREGKGYSTTQLGHKAGLGQSTISEIENGKLKPSMKAIEKICNAFGLSVPEFFASEIKELSPEIRQILNRAKTLTPAQLKTLDAFLATLNPGEVHHLRVAEQHNDYQRAGLDELLPTKEANLGNALTKLASIAFEKQLSREEHLALTKKLVDHYGQPEGSSKGAAHGPRSPGQIKDMPKN